MATDHSKTLTLDDYQRTAADLIVLRDAKGLLDIDREIRLIAWSPRAKKRAREVAENARQAARELAADQRLPRWFPEKSGGRVTVRAIP